MPGADVHAAQAAKTRPRPEPRRSRTRADIQGLRGIAVLLVIGNHAHLPGFGGGYAGVDMFFVISGYVITQQLLRQTGKGVGLGLLEFYSRRVRRIVPAASATLVGTLVAARVFLGSGFDPSLFGDVRWSALFGANARLISTGSNYFVPGTAPSLVTQFWSLAVEEQFYLVIPVITLVMLQYGRQQLRMLMWVLIPLVTLSAWWSAHSSVESPVAAYYSSFTQFWELGAGCLLALMMSRPQVRRVRWRQPAAVAGVLGLLLTVALLPGATDYPGTLAWLPVATAALLLAAGPTRLLALRPLTWIGDRSYSLYLWHWVWLMLPAQAAEPHTGPWWRLLELTGTAVTASLAYRYLENPVRRSRRLATDRVATGLLLVVCLVGVWTATLLVARFTPAAG